MWVAETIEQLHRHRRALSGTVCLVPTMGALHEGHVAHLHAGRDIADHTIVSIFVNPAQFGPNEDYQRYPRSLEADLAKCEAAGVGGVFNPSVEQMYPADQLATDVSIPALATILEGRARPGHFDGVCRVVVKLLNLVQPDVATFGCKDYQQLLVVRAMVSDLNLPVRIDPVATQREPDGLACSSRNWYLNDEQRKRAIGLSRALQSAEEQIERCGETDPAEVESSMQQVLEAHQVEPDYAVVRHPATLVELDCLEPELTGGVVALVAGRVDSVRLLDNTVLGRSGGR